LSVLRGNHRKTCDPWLRDIDQMGSLAGAAYLLHSNAGVLRHAQTGQKPFVADKAKSVLDSRPSVLVQTVKARPNDPFSHYLQSTEKEVSEKLPQG